MSFYKSKAATVTRLLKEYGQTVTLVRDSGKYIDPVTGICKPGAIEKLEFSGILKEIESSLINGTEIIQGDKLLILDTSHTPQKGDKVSGIDGDWQIVRIVSLNPAGVPLAYKVQVRR